jgi:hypothetical protein
MKIRLKFRDSASDDDRRRVLDDLEAAEPLFPGEEDPELSSLYVAETDEHRLAALQGSPAVEFAEPEAERRLHLPEELK